MIEDHAPAGSAPEGRAPRKVAMDGLPGKCPQTLTSRAPAQRIRWSSYLCVARSPRVPYETVAEALDAE
jgi:hypothetical protein